jgi:hypothetical protein
MTSYRGEKDKERHENEKENNDRLDLSVALLSY